MSAKFINIKNKEERESVNFTSDNFENHNQLFSIDELKHRMTLLQVQTIFKHLSENSPKCLLPIFNKIWESGNFLKSWKEATNPKTGERSQ
jgi:hypothetical protein